MVCFTSSLGVLIVYVKKKGGKRKAWLKSSRISRLGNYPNLLPLCVCFCWFELGLKFALVLFWFGLELSFDKDQKLCKETCRYFRESVVQISLTCVFVLAITWLTSHLDDSN